MGNRTTKLCNLPPSAGPRHVTMALPDASSSSGCFLTRGQLVPKKQQEDSFPILKSAGYFSLPLWHVLEVVANSPANRAGLRKGDCILEMNGVNIIGQSAEKVIELMTAPMDKLEFLVISTDLIEGSKKPKCQRESVSTTKKLQLLDCQQKKPIIEEKPTEICRIKEDLVKKEKMQIGTKKGGDETEALMGQNDVNLDNMNVANFDKINAIKLDKKNGKTLNNTNGKNLNYMDGINDVKDDESSDMYCTLYCCILTSRNRSASSAYGISKKADSAEIRLGMNKRKEKKQLKRDYNVGKMKTIEGGGGECSNQQQNGGASWQFNEEQNN